jgi:hypothetical protein
MGTRVDPLGASANYGWVNSDGARDVLKAVALTAQGFQHLSSAPGTRALAAKTAGVFSTGADLLTIPESLNDVRNLRDSVVAVKKFPCSTGNWLRLGRSAAIVTADTADILTTLHTTGLRDAGTRLPVYQGVFYAACFVVDIGNIAEGVHEAKKATAVTDKGKAEKKAWMLKAASSTFHLAMTILGAIGTFFASVVTGSLLVPLSMIGASAGYIMTKMALYFVENPEKGRIAT